MKKILSFIFVFLLLTTASGSVFAQAPTEAVGEARFAACDLCGYCPPNPPPSSWTACQKCIYPDINPDPTAMDSLAIDPETNLPKAAAAGRMYTFLGCITTGGGSFAEEGGAGNVVQVLLKIVFSTVGGIAFLYLIYGAFVIVTSQDNPERINYGRRVVYGAIIGLVFSLSSVLIINLVAGQILKIPGFNQVSSP